MKQKWKSLFQNDTVQLGLFPRYDGMPFLYIFSCIFLAFFTYFFFASFLFPNSDIIYYNPLLYVTIAAFICILLLGYWVCSGKLLNNPTFQTHADLFILALFVLLFGLQCAVFYQVYYQPGWDVSILTESAYWLSNSAGLPTNYFDYFTYYPNNVILLMIWTYLFKIFRIVFGFQDYLLLAVYISAFFINLSVFLTYKIAAKVFSLQKGLLVLSFGIPFLCFAPWVTNPYSDTMTILFPILILYCILFAVDDTHTRLTRILVTVFAGVLAAVGFMIKPSVLIVIIALFCMCVFFFKTKEKAFVYAKVFVVLLMAFCITYIPLKQYRTNVMVQSGISEERIDDMQYPFTHFIMMGMQEQHSVYFIHDRIQYGKWSLADTQITGAPIGQQAKISANVQEIKRRLSDFGVGGYLKFLHNKARWVLGDGTMYFGGEVPTGGPFQYMGSANFVQNTLWWHGNYYYFTAHVLQAIWLTIIALCCLPLFSKKDNYKNVTVAMCRLMIFGIILFILLLEGRSRYLINHLPIFILLAVYGVPLKETIIKH